MSKSESAMSPALQAHFEKRLKHLGLSLDDVHRTPINTADSQGGMWWRGEIGDDAPNPPHILRTNSLTQVKEWIGVSDAKVEAADMKEPALSFPSTPGKLTAKCLSDLAEVDQDSIVKAAKAFVYGHSSRVSAWQSVIEKYLGPFQVAAYALENIVVSPDSPWIISGTPPVTIVVGTVTVEPGGQIIVQVQASISAAQWIQQSGGQS